MASTRASTVEREQRRWPIAYQASQRIDRAHTWAFTDGGTDGWHAAAVRATDGGARCVCACRPDAPRAVGSELDGVILALELAPDAAQLVIVSDFLWSAYYINGWWTVRHPYLVERVPVARQLLLRKRFAKAHFIHHGGHDGQATDFSRWNDVADRLCKGRTNVDTVMDSAAELEDELSR